MADTITKEKYTIWDFLSMIQARLGTAISEQDINTLKALLIHSHAATEVINEDPGDQAKKISLSLMHNEGVIDMINKALNAGDLATAGNFTVLLYSLIENAGALDGSMSVLTVHTPELEAEITELAKKRTATSVSKLGTLTNVPRIIFSEHAKIALKILQQNVRAKHGFERSDYCNGTAFTKHDQLRKAQKQLHQKMVYVLTETGHDLTTPAPWLDVDYLIDRATSTNAKSAFQEFYSEWDILLRMGAGQFFSNHYSGHQSDKAPLDVITMPIHFEGGSIHYPNADVEAYVSHLAKVSAEGKPRQDLGMDYHLLQLNTSFPRVNGNDWTVEHIEKIVAQLHEGVKKVIDWLEYKQDEQKIEYMPYLKDTDIEKYFVIPNLYNGTSAGMIKQLIRVLGGQFMKNIEEALDVRKEMPETYPQHKWHPVDHPFLGIE